MARFLIGYITISDPDTDPLTGSPEVTQTYEIAGVVPSSWPYSRPSLVASGTVEFEQDKSVWLNDGGVNTNRPGPGVQWTVWTGTIKGIDRRGAISGSATVTLKLTGAAAPTNSVGPTLSGTHKIGAVDTIGVGTWANTVSYNFRYSLELDPVGAAGVYTPIVGQTGSTITWPATADGLKGRAEVQGVNGMGDVSAWVVTTAYTITYVAPTWSQQPTFGAGAYTEGNSIVINRGQATPNATITVKTFTVNGVDKKASLVATAGGWTYASVVGNAGPVVLVLTATNSGGSLDSATVNATLEAAPSGVPPSVTITPQVQTQPIIGSPIDITPLGFAGTPTPTVAYQWFNGRPSAGGASLGAGYQTFTPTPLDTHFGQTWWLRITLDNSVGPALVVEIPAGVVAKVFRDDFTTYPATGAKADLTSNGWTNVVDAQWQGGVVADAQSPSGKAARFGNNAVSSGTGGAYRTDISTFMNGRSYQFYEELLILRSGGVQTSGVRGAARSSNAGTVTGPSSYQAGLNLRDTLLRHVLPGEGNGSASGQNVTDSVTGYASGVAFWCRHRIENTASYLKVWVYGADEPVDWTSIRFHTGTIATLGPEISIDFAPGLFLFLLSMTVGVNTPAPTPAGVTLNYVNPGGDPFDQFATPTQRASAGQFVLNTTPAGFNFATAPSGGAGGVGLYVDGTPYIMNPASGPGVSGITTYPVPVVDGAGITQHGTMQNPGLNQPPSRQTVQGMTTAVPSSIQAQNSMVYDSALNKTPPGNTPLSYAAGVEATLLKSIGVVGRINDGSATTPFTQGVTPLTIVAQQPPLNAFRPGLSAPSKTSQFTTGDMNMSIFPNLPVVSASPNLNNLLRGMRYTQSHWWTSEDAGENFRGPYVTVGSAYIARGQGRFVPEVLALLCSNIDATIKRQLAMALCQQYIDAKARVLNSENAPANYGGYNAAVGAASNSVGIGGHHVGKKILFLMGVMCLGDTAMASYIDPTAKIFAEDSTLKMIDAAHVSANAAYVSADIGMPEWSADNLWYPGSENRSNPSPTTNYRQVNMNYHIIQSAAVRALGSTAMGLWNNQILHDYVDRLMERDFFRDPGDARTSYNKWARNAVNVDKANGPAQWHLNFYDMLKVQRPWTIWNWT